MTPRLIDAKYVGRYTLHLRFADGTEDDVDFENELEGEVFQPLKDLDFFQAFVLNPEIHTVTWPNGADFAPEYLYEKVRIEA